jgi:hypothetical protein
MEERRQNILVALFFSWSSHVIASILVLQQFILNEQIVTLMITFLFIIEKGNPRNKMVWSYERPRGFMEQHLLGFFFERMFHQHMRLSSTIFKYLCQVLTPTIDKTYTNMRACIPMETRVAITLSRWGSGNILLGCGEIYGVAIGTTFIIVKEGFVAIRTLLKP